MHQRRVKQAVLPSPLVKPLLSAARDARRSAVLRQAMIEFRRAGVAGARLPAIARGVGLSRASLYNYCTGREDLARQCYLDALQRMRGQLDESRGEHAGLARILAFVRTAIGDDHAVAAITGELDLLPPGQREEIERVQGEMFDALASVVSAGIADGSIRRCDPAIAARVIWGLVSWAPIGGLWTGRDEERLAKSLAIELPNLVEYGVAIAPHDGRIPLIAEELPERAGDRIEDITCAASALFNRRGIDGVSLDDVAEAMSKTKGLVYHHFESKGALVAACFERGFDIYDRIMARARAQSTGVEQSKWAVALNVQAQLESLHPVSLSIAYHRLPAPEQAAYTRRASALLDQSIAIGRQGRADGTQRSFDPESVSLVSAGAFLFLARWLPLDRKVDPVRVSAEVSELFLYGLGTARA